MISVAILKMRGYKVILGVWWNENGSDKNMLFSFESLLSNSCQKYVYSSQLPYSLYDYYTLSLSLSLPSLSLLSLLSLYLSLNPSLVVHYVKTFNYLDI